MNENEKRVLDRIDEIQSIQIKILDEFTRLCDKYRLLYSLGYGTMLGAVRHEGFIPWDDDIDVMMPRKDYEIFVKVALSELKEKIFLQNYRTDPNSIFTYSKIRMNGTVYKESMISDIDMHHGVYIDIFPLDYVSENLNKDKVLLKRVYMLSKLNRYRAKNRRYFTENKFHKAFISAVHPFIKKVNNTLIIKEINRLTMKNPKNQKEEMTLFLFDGSMYNYKRSKTTSDDFENFVLVKFVNKNYKVIRNYEDYLEKNYGDYMKLPKKEERYPKHDIVEIKLWEWT